MKTSAIYALILLVIGTLFASLAKQYHLLAPLFSWVAGSFGLAGVLYLGPGKRFSGKTEHGYITPGWRFFLMPHLFLTHSLWMIQRKFLAEPCCTLVAPHLSIGRRPLANEIPEDVDWIIDLTAEFDRPRSYPQTVRYTCLPTMDHTPLPIESVNLANEIAAYPGTVYINCALGHGRSAALAAMVLVRRGLAPDIGTAEKLLQSTRPLVKLSTEQRIEAEKATQINLIGQ